MATFGAVMRVLRCRRGLTLEAAASKVKTFKGYVSGWETGKVNPPSLKILRPLAKLYGVNLEDLVEFAWASKAPPIIRDRIQRKLDNPLARSIIRPAIPASIEPPEAAAVQG